MRRAFAHWCFLGFVRLWPWDETEKAGKDRALALAGQVLSGVKLIRAQRRIKAQWNVTRPAQDREIRKLYAYGFFLWFLRNWRGPEMPGREARDLWEFLALATNSEVAL